MQKQRIFFYTALLFVVGVIYLVFISSIPENPLTPKGSVRSIVNLLSPQGWNFFTKSPKESTFDIYKITGTKLCKINLENSCYKLGISRKGRLVSIQLISILSSNKQLKWSEFNGDLNEKPQFISEMQRIKNTIDNKYIPSGSYLIVENVVLPWVWVTKAKSYKKKFKVAWVLIE